MLITPLNFLIGYSLFALLFCTSLVLFNGPTFLLLWLVPPILVAAHYTPRRYYIGAQVILIVLTSWVFVATATDLGTALFVLLSILVFVSMTAEVIYRLSEAQRTLLTRLHASERWLNSIFAEAPIGIELFDGEGQLLDVNQAGLTIFGVSSVDQVKGFQLFEDPNVTAAVKERLQRGETVHYTNSFDFTLIKEAQLYETVRDGVAELDVLITPLGTKKSAAPTGYLVLTHEITEQVRQKQALQESESKLRAIFNASQDGIILTDEDGRIIEFNQGMQRLTGWQSEEVVGTMLWDFQDRLLPDSFRSPSRLEYFQQIVVSSLQNGKAPASGETVEAPFQHRDGSQRMVEQQSFVIQTDRGFQIGSICRDISERHRAAAALRTSEARYRMLAEMSSDSFSIVRAVEDGLWQVEWCTDDAFKRLTGYMRSELDTDVCHLERLTLPEDRDRAYLDSSPAIGIVRQEFRIRTKEGQIRWLRQRYRFEHDPSTGQPTVLYTAVEDVTDLKEVEKEALAFHLEKEQTRILTNFIQAASHEFRTPLSVIQLNLHLLQRLSENTVQQRRLGQVAEQVKTISALVDALLTLSTLDSDARISFQPLNLVALLADLANQRQEDAQARGVTLHVNVSPDLPDVEGSAQYLSMAIQALLDNAIRYTPAGGTVSVHISHADNLLVLAFEDSGSGIEPDILSLIFDRFYRLDHAHSTHGFGLGLSIAQKVAERHNGAITVESGVGVGSTFRLHLPLRPGAAVDAPGAQ